jgi:3-deoxy-manno-octulosonate cytidylyltransferase (CMP-KDO synthetase)
MPPRPPRCAVIPARYGSTRFPGKPLALLAGKPLVVHVLERVRAALLFDQVWVATDDARIAAVVQDAGGEARLTRPDHGSGTERVAEVAGTLAADAVVCNVQGDEPLLPVGLLHDLVGCMEAEPVIDLATAAHRCTDVDAFANRNVVKVVVDAAGRALYFSRAPIPANGARAGWLRHIGVYAWRRRALSRFVALPRGRLEQCEGLEQLRALEHGLPIRVLVTPYESLGVDTPEDLKAVASRLAGSLESQTANLHTPPKTTGVEP